MKPGTKLNVLLALTDHLAAAYRTGVSEYGKFFKNSQGAFKGYLKTYQAADGTLDEPSMRGSQNVVTTVKEKLDYFAKSNADYIDALFSQEATNASGIASTELFVDGESWGTFSSLELLRLNSLLKAQDLVNMYAGIPVREETKDWSPTSKEQYAERAVFEDTKTSGTKKTTTKESYILPDPNIAKVDGAKYTPQIGSKDTVMILGEYTQQNFSGELTHTQRALILQRLSKLRAAVEAAIKEANEVEIKESVMTASKLFGYLHG